VRISQVEGGNKLAHKLLQMGIAPGSYTRVLRKAPFGGPVLIEVDGLEIALSREIAAKVMVEEI
jgi:ferrous iron transport protein A